MKKILSLALVAIMVLSAICIPVSAADAVTITVGEGKQFNNLPDAFIEVSDKQYENVIFEVYGKLTLINEEDNSASANVYNIGSYKLKEVKFIGMNAEAEIFVDDSIKNPYDGNSDYGSTGMAANSATTVTFESLIINHNKYTNSVSNESQRINSFWYVNSKDKQIYNNCTFKNVVLSDAKNAIFRNCSFTTTRTSSYPLFYRGSKPTCSLTIENCTFNANRAVKLYTGSGVGELINELTVTGCTFSAITKAAFDVSGAVYNNADVTFENNTFNYCLPVNDPAEICLTDEQIKAKNKFNVSIPNPDVMFTGSDIKYFEGLEETDALKVGTFTAKTSVKNNLLVDLPVMLITAEYKVADNGCKTLVQVVCDSKSILAGKTENFENTITISETENRIVKTIITPMDFAYPISASAELTSKK